MAVDTSLVIGTTSIIGSIIAAYLSYVVYTYNRTSQTWLAVTMAFIVIVFYRTIVFATDFGLYGLSSSFLKSVEGVLFVIIITLFIWGFWSMKRSFETFDVVEKRARKKIRAFDRPVKKK